MRNLLQVTHYRFFQFASFLMLVTVSSLLISGCSSIETDGTDSIGQIERSVGSVPGSVTVETQLPARVAKPATLPQVLRITTPIVIDRDITIPESIDLHFLPGGMLTGSAEVTILGSIYAGPFQIFGNSLTVTGKPSVERTYAEWFGATGDGTHDDTLAIRKALALSRNGELRLLSRNYRVTDTIRLGGVATGHRKIEGSGPASTTLSCDAVANCLHIHATRGPLVLRGFSVRLTNAPSYAVAVQITGMWNSHLSDIAIRGSDQVSPVDAAGKLPGDSGYDPARALATQVGLLLRPLAEGGLRNPSDVPELEVITREVFDPEHPFNFGNYWNLFERLDISGFTYGFVMTGDESAVGVARSNQNEFGSVKINRNWQNIYINGAGGGNVFISSTAESANKDAPGAVVVKRQSQGSGIIWLGGEISGGRYKWAGQGFIVNSPSLNRSDVHSDVVGYITGAEDEDNVPSHLRAMQALGSTTYRVEGRRPQ